MAKQLAHVDIAQEDGTANPATAHSRVKAKTNGAVVSRSSVGVESVLGGALSPFIRVLAADFPVINNQVFTPITDFSVNIPPGASARIQFIVPIGTNTTAIAAGAHGGGFRATNPVGANGNLVGSWGIKMRDALAASAGSSFQGGVLSVAPSATPTDLTVTASFTISSTGVYPARGFINLTNLSTNTTANITIAFISGSSAGKAAIGSAVFALIS